MSNQQHQEEKANAGNNQQTLPTQHDNSSTTFNVLAGLLIIIFSILLCTIYVFSQQSVVNIQGELVANGKGNIIELLPEKTIGFHIVSDGKTYYVETSLHYYDENNLSPDNTSGIAFATDSQDGRSYADVKANYNEEKLEGVYVILSLTPEERERIQTYLSDNASDDFGESFILEGTAGANPLSLREKPSTPRFPMASPFNLPFAIVDAVEEIQQPYTE